MTWNLQHQHSPSGPLRPKIYSVAFSSWGVVAPMPMYNKDDVMGGILGFNRQKGDISIISTSVCRVWLVLYLMFEVIEWNTHHITSHHITSHDRHQTKEWCWAPHWRQCPKQAQCVCMVGLPGLEICWQCETSRPFLMNAVNTFHVWNQTLTPSWLWCECECDLISFLITDWLPIPPRARAVVLLNARNVQPCVSISVRSPTPCRKTPQPQHHISFQMSIIVATQSRMRNEDTHVPHCNEPLISPKMCKSHIAMNHWSAQKQKCVTLWHQLRRPGIEPRANAWKAFMLPLHHRRYIQGMGIEPTTSAVLKPRHNQLDHPCDVSNVRYHPLYPHKTLTTEPQVDQTDGVQRRGVSVGPGSLYDAIVLNSSSVDSSDKVR